MKKIMDINTLKFECTKNLLLTNLIISILLFCIISYFIVNNISSRNTDETTKIVWGLFMYLVLITFLLLLYISNKRSCIRLTTTDLIIKKPINYPFPNIETINISYEKIKNIKISKIWSLDFWNVYWYCINITFKNSGWKNVKFYWLYDWNKFGDELKWKWMQVYLSSFLSWSCIPWD